MPNPFWDDSLLFHERQAQRDGFVHVIGIDEAGRGPLAGPVVSAAVCLKPDINLMVRIDDSKALTARQRQIAFDEIMKHCAVGIGIMNEAVIDQHNILQATFFSMQNAVCDLYARWQKFGLGGEWRNDSVCLLIDGNQFQSELPWTFKCLVKGDSKSLSIACASIIAKVYRDRILRIYDKIFPLYGFAQHKGYPTGSHRRAIREYGLSMIHRKTFSVSP